VVEWWNANGVSARIGIVTDSILHLDQHSSRRSFNSTTLILQYSISAIADTGGRICCRQLEDPVSVGIAWVNSISFKTWPSSHSLPA
jgi:hypothetical protein